MELHKPALVALHDQIRSSTATMSSIPKAMKFLQIHYETLTELYQNFAGSVEKVCLLAYVDVIFNFSHFLRPCLLILFPSFLWLTVEKMGVKL